MVDTASIGAGLDEGPLVLLGDSASVRLLREAVDRCSRRGGHVLITGDPGTGATEIAGVLHHANTAGPFATLVCTPRTTADEVAVALRSAAGGTLYAEEVDACGESAQRALLQALRRAPSGEEARVISFTAVDLRQAAARDGFDAELAAALFENTLELPPLRDRLEDISVLANAIVARANARSGQSAALSQRTADALQAHRWPRNLPELVATVEELLRGSADVELPQDTYRVPVRRQAVSLLLASGAVSGGEIFLTDEQRAEDVFERGAAFLAVAASGAIRFYALGNIAAVSMPRESVTATSEVRVSVRVRLLAAGASDLEGALSYAPHEARKRAIDHLNGPERALLVHGANTLHIVAKAHVAYVEEGA